ncbi:MAG: NAD+ synthase [Methanoregulaceae archaeon]|nr:NAD+ synthase [Methanoregulaceae archaeon]
MYTEHGCALGQIEQMIRFAVWSSETKGIVIGISGGIDSALSAVMCCRAVGCDRVYGLTLTTAVTRADDITDASDLCRTLGMHHTVMSIEPVLSAYRQMPGYSETPYLLGNLMARTRMVILYYHANRDSLLVCGTSNRTEYLLGYTTKFGDNAADLQPVIHLYKTDIFEYARELGIPDRIIQKTPTAGLWAGQSDEAEIGLTYPEIDAALRNLEKNGWNSTNPSEERVLALVKKNSHKRMNPPSLSGFP